MERIGSGNERDRIRKLLKSLPIILLCTLVVTPAIAGASAPVPTSGTRTMPIGANQSNASPDYVSSETCFETNVSYGILWTPIVLVDSPYDGSATGSTTTSTWAQFTFAFAGSSIVSYSQHSVSYSVPVSNGEAIGLFEADGWTSYKFTTMIVPYFGTGPCTASYAAQITNPNAGKQETTYPLLGTISSSGDSGPMADSGVLTSFPQPVLDTVTGESYNSVTFSSLDFQTTDSSVNSCNTGQGTSLSVSTSTWMTGTIGISLSGYSVSGSLALTQGSSTSTVYTYTFDNVYGTWAYQYLNGQLNNGLAFSFTPCSSGGGGCVLNGTFVTLANGTSIPVQQLLPGMKTLSYDTLNQSLIVTTVSKITESNVTSIMSINSGQLLISGLRDQPVYVKLPNGTKEWLTIGSLNDSMQLFQPSNNTWIRITNITMKSGNFSVYDVQTARLIPGGNSVRSDYIANGILVDIKYG